MKPFTKQETIVVTLIFLVVFAFTLKGLSEANRRARDAQRKQDLGQMTDALNTFYADYGFFPASENGKIKFCKAENFDTVISEMRKEEKFDLGKLNSGLRACDWGEPFSDLIEDGSDYLKNLNGDPRQNEGIYYLYLSNTRHFQIYSYLEGEADEDGYDVSIVQRNFACGNRVCSFGKSSDATPLDRSIEEYEEELSQKTRQ